MLDLLRIEIDLLWGIDDRGRVGGPHSLVVGAGGEGALTVVGDAVRPDLAEVLVGLIRPAGDPSVEPLGLSRCRELLGDVTVASGPTYLVDREISYPVGESIVRSVDADAEQVRALGAPTWENDEWNDLIDGTLGPWAMAVVDRTVASICHTPRRSDVAVEAGTWTDPEFRGRGFAAATTAAWACLIPAGVHIFYSTWAENRSSQRVVARLGLPCIGWLWKLTPTTDAADA